MSTVARMDDASNDQTNSLKESGCHDRCIAGCASDLGGFPSVVRMVRCRGAPAFPGWYSVPDAVSMRSSIYLRDSIQYLSSMLRVPSGCTLQALMTRFTVHRTDAVYLGCESLKNSFILREADLDALTARRPRGQELSTGESQFCTSTPALHLVTVQDRFKKGRLVAVVTVRYQVVGCDVDLAHACMILPVHRECA
ncbi:hypothetical protein DAEQUDRAFT_725445 [Daedalea quercina L-15889]|uniref:Uncharacterized protein n=1 Tax=Daedalea quercina L-15889 TaxID=1314783 RepID=A0A165RAQ9_9APHY|nr:hypothetical protein DAEQUDRAFT_725445 [Daedalea quercina L-15889]